MSERSDIKLRHIVPSMVTVFAICAGLTSVRMSLEGHLEMALSFILLAVFLDAADGKLARYLDTASPFGVELDTLTDFFNFGIAPGFLLYHTLYLGTPYASIGWMAVMVLAVCCALRLVRFNLSSKATPSETVKPDYFSGVSAPALACLALMPVFMHLSGWQATDLPLLRAGYIAGVGVLAVSTVPTFSIKHAKVSRAQLPFIMVAAVIVIVGLMSHPWPTLILANCLYLASLPVSSMLHRKHIKRLQTAHAYSAD